MPQTCVNMILAVHSAYVIDTSNGHYSQGGSGELRHSTLWPSCEGLLRWGLGNNESNPIVLNGARTTPWPQQSQLQARIECSLKVLSGILLFSYVIVIVILMIIVITGSMFFWGSLGSEYNSIMPNKYKRFSHGATGQPSLGFVSMLFGAKLSWYSSVW